MYKNFFGLRESPFNINPDPRFLHRTPRIQEALDQLTYGVQNRKGLLLLTGEVGTGKTTLINHLLDWLRERQTPTAFIFNSHLKPDHLFEFILNDFGISTDFHLVSNMLLDLNQWLLKLFRAGSTPVLIVDEAQGLSLELLEEIRLLLNLETASEKLLQIVLVGQPELEEKLKRPAMRQLRQRIALRCTTAPLTFEESRGYIAERLRIAGATREPIFDSDAVEALHFYSRGIPRVMNLLCEHALINAYVEGLNPVPPQMVEEAARDFLMEEFQPLDAHLGMISHMDGILSLPHPQLSRDPRFSFREQAGSLLLATPAVTSAAVLGLAEEEREPTVGQAMTATVPQKAESASLEQTTNTPLSVLDLVPAPPNLGAQQVNPRLALNRITAQSHCAAELVATMERLLSTASSFPVLQRETLKVEPERSPALRFSSHATRLGPSIPTAIWPNLYAKALRTAKKAMTAAGVVLRQWKLGFSHDWKLTITAVNFPQRKKSFGHWLHQPFSTKPMAAAGVVLRQWKLGFSHDWKLTITAVNFPQRKKSFGHWLHQPFSTKPMAAAGVVLRQWKLGFSHDWKLTITAVNFPQRKKSFGHWLHQPFSTKPMTPGKNQTV